MPVDLKSSISLPKTDFPMKANLPQNEPKMLARWEEMRIYDEIRKARAGAPQYVLHDGPPYANGNIHLGTAFNKCLKDFVVKSKSMAGFDSPYVPGWDCHGLPIENKVDEQLGRKKLEMEPLALRKACREYAEKYVDLQRSQFKRLGVLGRWEQPYLTMSPQYEAAILETLFGFFDRGLVYKGLRPVLWCLFHQTALAEAEVEYANHTSPSVWVKYALQSDPRTIDEALAAKRIGGQQIFTIIWTTTPWTLPSSLAVAFHPEEEYVALDVGNLGIYIVAEKLARATMNACFRRGPENDPDAPLPIVARMRGKQLEHTYFIHPFLEWPERKILGVIADYVMMDQGTGAVHTAPSHGADDFRTGAKYKLSQLCIVDGAGRFTEGLEVYKGKTVWEANPAIIELLKSRGALLHEEKIEHSYPTCWRCHKPVIFRATEQWFIDLDKPFASAMERGLTGQVGADHTLRRRALQEIEKIDWDPAWGLERISNMVATRPDWCISRQRVWGVPIAVLHCATCRQVLQTAEVNRAIVALFAQGGSDAWYTTTPEQIVPAGTKCKCGGASFTKEMDIIDVWFESGSSQAAVLGREPGLPFPSDMYLEGGDQHRGWFQSSLLCSVGTRERAPYRVCITPGWTLDPQRRAMHKSLGNDVDPVDIANRMGGEIVRLWCASVDFREDVIGSEDLMKRVAEDYRKIRNTFKYILGNLHGFDPQRDQVAFAAMQPLDQYMLLRLADLTTRVRQWYSEFEFHKLYHALHDFCVVDLSSVYFDILKDRLYTFSPRGSARRSGQTAIWHIGEALVRLLAPIMSFTADEVWQFLPATSGRPASVHLALFPAPEDLQRDTAVDAAILRSDWDALMSVRDSVLKALEGAREGKLVGKSLEAQLRISAPEPVFTLLRKYEQQLREFLQVSGVALAAAQGGNGADAGVHTEVTRAAGQKCDRCWNYSVQVGNDPQYPTVCERCSPVLREIQESGVGSQ